METAELAAQLAELKAGQKAILDRLEALDGAPARLAVLESRTNTLEARQTGHGKAIDKITWYIIGSGTAGAIGGHAITRLLGVG